MAKAVVMAVGAARISGLPELGDQDYRVVSVDTPEDALERLGEVKPGIVLLAWNTRHRESQALLLERCQGAASTVALVAEGDLDDYLRRPAADDFLVLPLRPRELSARLGRLLTQRELVSTPLLRSGDLTIDLEQYRVWVGERSVDLTYTEYELLRFLASNEGRVFSRESLLNRVWGYDYFGGSRTVDVHIRRLRAKLEDKDHTFIETVRNVGYRFRPSPSP